MILGGISSRVIVPEILDNLSPDDPRAIRSRKDLQFLDWFLGNTRWFEKQLGKRLFNGTSVAELGAGQGHLTLRLRRSFSKVSGLDFAPAPAHLPPGVDWIQGDFFQSLTTCSAKAVAGALILHHFNQNQLEELGVILRPRRLILFVEPLRTMTSLWLCTPLLPFVGSVTRHDMRASIRAGFLPGELGELLGLDREWTISETLDWRGTLRFMAWRD